MAATAIGASHLVLAPTAGASFGYVLLWVLLLSHLFKYPGFEFGPRFAVATGRSLLDGYRRVPGPRNWALWIFLAGTVVQGVTVLAGVLGVAASVAAAALPGLLPLAAWSALLGGICALLLAAGGFDGLSALSKWMLLALAAMTAVAFAATPPPLEAWRHLVVPRLPGEAVVLVAAILGWMPTGLDVSVWHSLWALERREAWLERAEERTPELVEVGEREALGVGLLDMRIGYGLSLALSVMFLVLGAEVLAPAGQVPEGGEVAVTLAQLYTEVLGGWILPLFLVAAFFGMFSTAYGVLDGFPRAFQETLRAMGGAGDGGRAEMDGPSTFRPAVPYWTFLGGALVLAVVESVLIPDPVVLVTVAAVASFLLAPVTFALNYYCVTRLVDDPSLRPGRVLRGWAAGGIGFMALSTGLYLWVQASG
jgi:Mn2+/Fe2+ NRAMP family transporter